MSFSPQNFLANIAGRGGPAKTNRFEVYIPVPNYLSNFTSNSIINELNITLSGDIDRIISNLNNRAGINLSFGGISVSQILTLQCESAEIPGKTLQTADVKIYGPTFKVPYQTLYSDLTLTFICSNSFLERKIFDSWMNAIMPFDTNNLRFPKDFSTRYLTNIQIVQYDDFVNSTHVVECIDAFPIGIASQPLNWGDENFHRMTVSFSYHKIRNLK